MTKLSAQSPKTSSSVRRQPARDRAPATVPPVVHETLRGGGRPLDAATRALMEPRFGHDFSRVRVHTDRRAAESARAINASAYTAGSHIVLDTSTISPGEPTRDGPISHELAHVVQQRRVRPELPRVLAFGAARAEAEADRTLKAVTAGRPAPYLPEAPISIVRAPRPARRPAPPKVIPAGRRVIIQWGDDSATVVNVKALPKGLRSGPNAAGASQVVHYSQLAEASLAHARELEVVIHGEPVGEPIPDSTGVTPKRYIRPGENMPRADIGLVGQPRGTIGPKLDIAPEEMARQLYEAGFGQGRWTRYRIRLVMCFSGVGGAESYAARLSAAMAARGVQTEVLGGTGRVSAAAVYNTEIVPPGESRPRSTAQPQAGIPQAEKAYSEAFDFPMRRPGTGYTRAQAAPGAKRPTGMVEPPVPAAATKSSGPTTGAAAPVAERPVPAGKPAAADVHVVPRRGIGTRVAVGTAKCLGPMILDLVTGYFLAKHEEKRIQEAIAAQLHDSRVERRIVELLEQQRLDIAYKQSRGIQLFATVSLRVNLTNGVLDNVEVTRIAITETDQTRSATTVMSDDPIFGTENSRRWEEISVPLPAVPVSGSESLRLQLRAHDESGGGLSDPAATPARRAERERLLSEIQRAEQDEEKARLAEIARPTVIPDPRERSQQQADIAERLRKLNEQHGSRAQGRPGVAASTSPALLPTPSPAMPTLLPGAPGRGSLERAAAAVDHVVAWTKRLHEAGSVMESRIGTKNSPTQIERQAFLAEELRWRLAMKGFMNHFQSEARPEAVNRLSELMDDVGPKLRQIRIHLGGE